MKIKNCDGIEIRILLSFITDNVGNKLVVSEVPMKIENGETLGFEIGLLHKNGKDYRKISKTTYHSQIISEWVVDYQNKWEKGELIL